MYRTHNLTYSNEHVHKTFIIPFTCVVFFSNRCKKKKLIRLLLISWSTDVVRSNCMSVQL